MNICVCIKQVPDTSEIRIDPVTNTLIRTGVPSIVNPFDTYALEAAVRLKEKHGGRVIVISMGPPQAEAAIRSCLATGADEGYLISGRRFGGSDTLATSYILSEAIRYIERAENLKFDLILAGKQAVDGDTAQVAPELAEHLGLPQVTYALDLEVEDGTVKVKRDCDSGYDIISVSLPAVITVVRLPFEPRYPSIGPWLESKKHAVPILSEEDLTAVDLSRCGLSGSPTRVKKTFTPSMQKHGVILDRIPPEEAAAQVADLLREAKII